MKNFLTKMFSKEKKTYPICSAVVAAAGSSSRMGDGSNKLLLPLEGIPVLARTLRALDDARLVTEIVIATREEDLLTIGDLCKTYGISKPVKIVRGGATRAASVLAAALECRPDGAFIAVHDGARPLAEPELIDSVIQLAFRTNAAAPAVPVKDTVKVVADGKVVSTPDRETLRSIQTPQVFDAALLRAALQAAVAADLPVTDDCSAVDMMGFSTYTVEGDTGNIKLTLPEDMVLAEAILKSRGE